MLPSLALANEMFVGYMYDYIYRHEVTYVELLCSSVMNTAMVSLVLEKFGERVTGASKAHQAGVRLGAKGNVTCFALPWEDVLSIFTSSASNVILPRIGSDLTGLVQVLVESNNAADLQIVVQRARVRRAVVVHLIRTMVESQHPAYARVDFADMERRASHLPVNGIPPEIVALVDPPPRHKQSVGGKAAVPDAQPLVGDGDPFLGHVVGVQLDGYGSCATDTNEQRINAIDNVAEQLESQGNSKIDDVSDNDDGDTIRGGVPRVHIKTGSAMQDQFTPMFAVLAFAFLFRFGVGTPDIARRPRSPRDLGAPLVSLWDYSAALIRRIEGQFRRDWVFMFAMWNLLFRTVVNTSKYIFRNQAAKTESVDNNHISGQQFCDAAKAITRGLTVL